jgi:isoleucyl-tRNA synthetase
VYDQKRNDFSKYQKNKKLFPANLVMESEEHHSRWFLTQLVTSVALTGIAPFKNLKTLGHLVDDQQEPFAYV